MGKKIRKAVEISDAKISFVSFVNKAANKREFLITKADDGDQAQFSTLGKILKVDKDTHYVTGVVYEPLKEDTDGNFMTEEEIRKAAHWFAKNGDKVDLQHSFESADGVTVVETYIAPCDMEIGGVNVIKGTWILTTEVENPEVWDKVQKGEYTGYSMGGRGVYSEEDVELVEKTEQNGLIAKIAAVIGGLVEKGEVKDKYLEGVKGNSFWRLFRALEETLYSWDWETDVEWFETDETKIRSALSEFSELLISLLTSEESIMKTLAKAEKPVIKAGKKISSKNLSTLEKIKNDVDTLFEAVSDEKKEEDEDMTKQEVQDLILEEIKKAKEQTTPAGGDGKDEPLTADVVKQMIADAVAKATAPKDDDPPGEGGDDGGGDGGEGLTEDAVQKMIADAVAPILKARGLPSNLDNDDGNVTKDGEHYLAGIL